MEKREFSIHQPRMWEARPDLRAAMSRVIITPPAEQGKLAEVKLSGEIKTDPASQVPIRRDSLYFSTTSGVDELAREAVLLGIQKMQDEVKSALKLVNVGSFNNGYGPYKSTDWYQSKSLISGRNVGFGNQVNAYALDKLLREEPTQKTDPHLNLFVINRDLTESARFPLNLYVYGMSNYPNAIISTARVSEDKNLMVSLLAALAAHEMGHILGLVSRNFNIGKGEMRSAHCNEESGSCVMAQVDFPGCKSLITHVRELIERDSWLCRDCLDEAAFKKAQLEANGVVW